jgi:hypothetical protein
MTIRSRLLFEIRKSLSVEAKMIKAIVISRSESKKVFGNGSLKRKKPKRPEKTIARGSIVVTDENLFL